MFYFQRLAPLKCHCAHKLNVLQGKIDMIMEKKIMALITVCPQLLNICAKASTARIILFLRSSSQLENPVEI